MISIFFRPRLQSERHKRISVTAEESESQTQIDESQAYLHPRSVTLTSKNANDNYQPITDDDLRNEMRSRSVNDSLTSNIDRQSSAKNSSSSLTAELDEPDIHPSDCSWAFSSSSNSSNSLEDNS